MTLRKAILSFFLPAALLVGACGPENVVNPVTPPAPKDDPEPETPDTPGTPDIPGDGAVSMTICTFNIRYENSADKYPDGSSAAWSVRAPAVKKFIDETKPDLIGLQEIRKGQSTWFSSQLSSEYGYYDVSRDNASGTTVASAGGEGVGFLYKKERFELVMKDFFWLDENPRTRPAQNSDGTYGAWNSACRRVTVYGVFKDKKHGNSYVYFFPTHYDHKSAAARQNAADLMVAQMKSICKVDNLKDPGNVVIFHVGDLNVTYDSVQLKGLKDNMSYARTAIDGPDKGTATFNGFGNSNSIIDHIFYGGNVKPVKYWVVSGGYGLPYLSDHNPVLFTWEYQ